LPPQDGRVRRERADDAASHLKASDVLGFGAFRALRQLEFHIVAFRKGLEPVAGDARVMNEDVISPFLFDESEALLIVEPLDFASCHALKPPDSELPKKPPGQAENLRRVAQAHSLNTAQCERGRYELIRPTGNKPLALLYNLPEPSRIAVAGQEEKVRVARGKVAF